MREQWQSDQKDKRQRKQAHPGKEGEDFRVIHIDIQPINKERFHLDDKYQGDQKGCYDSANQLDGYLGDELPACRPIHQA